MSDFSPNVVIVAGPNGSGKSTAAPSLLRDYLGLTEFVNADVIARGLSGFQAEAVAIRAGRIMQARLRELASQRRDFAFETTLASRSFASWLRELRDSGYRAHLLFLWLSSPELAISRVAARVQQGGHHVQEEIVRRRYQRGLQNFFKLYRPIVDSWVLFDNGSEQGRQQIASYIGGEELLISNVRLWDTIRGQYA
ncbi:MAG: zeta toxin family protein [Desulfurellaceae bacterium]|nr:zeta toxin family protein [Desulfurellaceae bacterium]